MKSKHFNSPYMKLFFIFVSLFSCSVYAGKDLTLNFSKNPLTYDGPADATASGQVIGPEWVASGYLIDMCRAGGNIIATATISPISMATSATTNIDGVTYQIFSTGAQGVGWVMGVKDTNANNFTALGITENQWYPSPGTPTKLQNIIGGYSKITLVKTAEHLQTGTTIIPAQNLAKISCYNSGGALVDSAFIKINSETINVEAKGCQVESAKSAVVNLPDVYVRNFPAVGSVSDVSASNTISIKCDQGVNVSATVSDQSNLSNTSDVLNLTASSTAKGLGIQTYYNNTLLKYGPDDSSSGTTNQFFIAESTSPNETIQLPLTFKYVRTGDLAAGTVDGLVGVTFSYQ